jgi:hypothetical protein
MDRKLPDGSFSKWAPHGYGCDGRVELHESVRPQRRTFSIGAEWQESTVIKRDVQQSVSTTVAPTSALCLGPGQAGLEGR